VSLASNADSKPPLYLFKEEPLQRQQGADRVFADSTYLFLGLSPDLAVDVETYMMPAKDLLHKSKPDEFFGLVWFGYGN